MPTYEYRCGTCQQITERFGRMTEDLPRAIPCEQGKCGGVAFKIISATSMYVGATPDWKAYRSDRLPKNLPRELVPQQVDGKAVITNRRQEDRVLKHLGYDRE